MRFLLLVFLLGPVLPAFAGRTDPRPGAPFLVSTLVTFDSLPRAGDRSLIISKYDGATLAAPGWAIALRRTQTKYRPEVYWKTAAGGGWLTFSDYPFKPKRPYLVTLVAISGEFVGLYLQEVSLKNKTYTPQGQVYFLGAHELSSTEVPESAAELSYVARADDRRDAGALPGRGPRGTVSSVLIGEPGEVPKSVKMFLTYLDGGCLVLPKQIKPEAVLFHKSPE